MTINQIPNIRLQAQNLLNQQFIQPNEVVAHLAAIQSQDFAGAKWAINMRLKNPLSDAEIEKSFNDGKILRTHALRPTWHFVTPEDIRWIEMLSEPQVSRMMKYYEKQLELDEKIYKKSAEVFQKVLAKKNFMTRAQLGKELEKEGIKASGQKLGHIVFYSELNAIICSGPRIGKQFSYSLVDDLVPKQKMISREEALEKLLFKFFNSRGAATLKDFAKWSMINITEIKQHEEVLAKKFPKEIRDGETYYLSPNLSTEKTPSPPLVHLLPNYDEYISSYADFSAIFHISEHTKNLTTDKTPIFWNTLLIDGIVTGSWQREIKGKILYFKILAMRDLISEEKEAIEKIIEHYSNFLGYVHNLKF